MPSILAKLCGGMSTATSEERSENEPVLGRQGLYQTIQTYDIIIFHHISGYWSRAQKANAPVILPYSLSIVFLDMRKASLCAKNMQWGPFSISAARNASSS
jgi:hypothetical protein